MGYTLELWTVAGKLERTLTRNVAWFPRGADIPGDLSPNADDENRDDRSPFSARRPPSAIRDLYVDDTGLLIVYVDVVNDRWRWIKDNAERAALFPSFIDRYVEVIDPDAGVVLASLGPLRDMRPHEIPVHFNGTRFGYRRTTGASEPYAAEGDRTPTRSAVARPASTPDSKMEGHDVQ
jgi:hypothetical protein